MVLNPTSNIVSRPDYTDRVSAVDRANNRQFQTRRSLPDDETRLSFQAAFTDETSAFPWVFDELTPSDGPQSLLVAETGNLMPYQPPAGVNVIAEQVSISLSKPAELNFYLDGQAFSPVEVQAGDFARDQIAALAELAEFVNTLDGSHTLEYTIENTGREPIRGSISIRAIQKVVV